MFRFLIFYFGLFGLTFNAWAGVSASVQKNNFLPDEMIVLTIKSDENISEQPDLSVLKNKFSVAGTSISKQSYMVNGQVSYEISWKLNMLPLQEGEQIIPPITVGMQKTNPIKISVSSVNTPSEMSALNDSSSADNKQNMQSQEPIYRLETQIEKNKEDPFVQQKINYLVYVKDNGALQNISLSFDPSTDFLIEELEKPYVKDVADRREIVFSYVLFPQKSGVLQVPTVHMDASVYQKPLVDTFFQGGFFNINLPSFLGLQTPVSLSQKGPSIRVRPAPRDYSDRWWLPAEKISISAKFVDLPAHVVEGAVLVREIVLSAVGLTDKQLPELDIVSNEDWKQYPEKPVGETIISNGKVTAVSKTLNVMIPQKTGELVLPEIKIPWFNVLTQTVETAVLPAETIKVEQNYALKNIENEVQSQSLESQKNNEKNVFQKTVEPYLKIFLAFLGGILISYLCFKPKKVKQVQKTAEIKTEDIVQTAQKKDLKKLRDQLISWAVKNYPTQNVSNLKDVAKVLEDEDFNRAIDALSMVLYADQDKSAFDEKYFRKTFQRAIKNQRKNKSKKQDPIPPLYQ